MKLAEATMVWRALYEKMACSAYPESAGSYPIDNEIDLVP